jgi:hypothetical protein
VRADARRLGLVRLRLRQRDRERAVGARAGAGEPRRADRLHLRLGRQDGARGAPRVGERHTRRLGGDRPGGQAGDRRRRGPPLLGAPRRRHSGHGACLLGGHSTQEGRPGRLDDHPAVHQEPVHGGRPDREQEAEGGGARLAARAALVQGPDPHRLPEHHLLREWGLRHRDGRARVLRQARARPRACRGGSPRRHPGESGRPGPAARQCSDSCSTRG